MAIFHTENTEILLQASVTGLLYYGLNDVILTPAKPWPL